VSISLSDFHLDHSNSGTRTGLTVMSPISQSPVKRPTIPTRLISPLGHRLSSQYKTRCVSLPSPILYAICMDYGEGSETTLVTDSAACSPILLHRICVMPGKSTNPSPLTTDSISKSRSHVESACMTKHPHNCIPLQCIPLPLTRRASGLIKSSPKRLRHTERS
jgi:hypothetical protein